jgi:hypothetical protein
MKVKEQYHVKLSNRSATFKSMDNNVDITTAWQNTEENIKNFSHREFRLLKF